MNKILVRLSTAAIPCTMLLAIGKHDSTHCARNFTYRGKLWEGGHLACGMFTDSAGGPGPAPEKTCECAILKLVNH